MSLALFSKYVGGKHGVQANCRACRQTVRLATSLTPRGRAGTLITDAKARSRLRGAAAPSITADDLVPALTKGTCAVTGLKFDFARSKEFRVNPFAPSLDRPDNTKPYTRENFRLVCWAVNTGCSDWGLDIYLRIAATALGVRGPQ